MRLENKIAIITGAGSGMGRAASLLFAKEGAKIAAVDINLEAAEETAKQIKVRGRQCVRDARRRLQIGRHHRDGR